MSQPTREEVEAFIAALNYGMKVSHKPEFLIALAEGWLANQKPEAEDYDFCTHEWVLVSANENGMYWHCDKCCSTVRHFDDKTP